jgi:hypothetical protein
MAIKYIVYRGNPKKTTSYKNFPSGRAAIKFAKLASHYSGYKGKGTIKIAYIQKTSGSLIPKGNLNWKTYKVKK